MASDEVEMDHGLQVRESGRHAAFVGSYWGT